MCKYVWRGIRLSRLCRWSGAMTQLVIDRSGNVHVQTWFLNVWCFPVKNQVQIIMCFAWSCLFACLYNSARAGGLAFCPTWTKSRVTRSHARYHYTNWLRNGNLGQSLADSSTWPLSFFLSLRLSSLSLSFAIDQSLPTPGYALSLWITASASSVQLMPKQW